MMGYVQYLRCPFWICFISMHNISKLGLPAPGTITCRAKLKIVGIGCMGKLIDIVRGNEEDMERENSYHSIRTFIKGTFVIATFSHFSALVYEKNKNISSPSCNHTYLTFTSTFSLFTSSALVWKNNHMFPLPLQSYFPLALQAHCNHIYLTLAGEIVSQTEKVWALSWQNKQRIATTISQHPTIQTGDGVLSVMK